MRILFNIILFLFLFSSCQKDDLSGKEQQNGLFIPVSFAFVVSGPAQAGDVSSGTVSTKSVNEPFSVSYSHVNPIQTKAPTTFTNVWVLQFSSNTCVKATNIGTVSTTNINPTLISGSGYTIYIIANGPSSSTAFTTSTTKSSLESTLAYSESIGSDTPYVGKLDNVTITTDGVLNSGSSQAPIMTLTRIAAKISLTLNYNVTGYTLQSVEMYNAPKNMYYLNGNSTSVFPVASSDNINQSALTANVKPSTVTSGTYVWYVGENKRGINSSVTTSYNRDFLHTPTTNNSQYYCTYIRIKAKRNDGLGEINYYIYPGENNTTDFNVIRNYDYNLNVMIQGNAAAQESMEGVDGRVRIASSNSYMVTTNSTITIPVNIKGNANQPLKAIPTDNSTIGDIAHAAASVAVFWQTSSGLISSISNVYNGKVNITTSGTSGSAIVAAYSGANGTGNILWSWHLWVTSYKPDIQLGGITYPFNNFVWMDRNLGATTSSPGYATTFGLYYQWGRKDPFPSASGVAIGTTTSQSIFNRNGTPLVDSSDGSGTGIKSVVTPVLYNLANTILHPDIMYYTHDWYSNSTEVYNDNLWGGENSTTPDAKTIYDPCPNGWRVPAFRNGISPFNGLSCSGLTWNYGWPFLNFGYVPAAGCRNGGSGNIDFVGITGWIWSASMPLPRTGSDGSGLFTDNASPTPTIDAVDPRFRSHCAPVRCVKE